MKLFFFSDFSRSSMNTLIFHRIVGPEIEVRQTLVDKIAWLTLLQSKRSLAIRRFKMGKLKTYQQQIQEIVEKGINSAEAQQKKLSAKPFEYAEKLESGAREYTFKSLREHYYGYSEKLFEQLRSLNLRMGSFAADILSKIEKEAAEGTDAAADAVSDAADDVTSVAQSTKDKVNTRKPTATKTPAKKTTTTASA
jgi:hypothetical protein